MISYKKFHSTLEIGLLNFNYLHVVFFPVSVISKTIFEMIFRIFEFDFFPTLLTKLSRKNYMFWPYQLDPYYYFI